MNVMRRLTVVVAVGVVIAAFGGFVLSWIAAPRAWFYVLPIVLSGVTVWQAMAPRSSARSSSRRHGRSLT
jgi:hypothetical protein